MGAKAGALHIAPLCQELSHAEAYSAPEAADFKKVILGTNEWLFRSRVDLKTRFVLTAKTKDYFSRLNRALALNDTQLVLAVLPTRGITGGSHLMPPFSNSFNKDRAVSNYYGLLEDLRGTGVSVADMAGVENLYDFFLPRDNHWTAAGARFTASKVAESVVKLPVYRGMERTDYVTTETTETAQPPERMLEFVNETCGTSYERTPVRKTYSTTVAESATSKEDLFGDKAPAIALIGTSNSTDPEPSYANFVGFLREALRTEVLNVAVSGGSLEGSITNFLVNGGYRGSHPKVIIWEMSAYYGFNRQSFFREIIPAIYGECTQENEVAHWTGTINKSGSAIFSNIAGSAVKGHNYYVALHIDNPEARTVRIQFTYEGDKVNTVKLERPLRSFPTHNGSFFVELSDDYPSALSSVVVELKEGESRARAQLCRVPKEVDGAIVQSTPVDDLQEDAANDPSFARGHGIRDRLQLMVRSLRQALGEYLPFGYMVVGARSEEDDLYWAGDGASDGEVDVVSPHLPDLSNYNKAEILKLVPAATDGVVRLVAMEQAPPLRKFAFDKRLEEFRNIQGRVSPLAVHVYSGHYTLQSLLEAINDTSVLKETPEGYVLRLPVAIYPGASLVLQGLEKPLLLSQDRGAFIVSAGDLFIIDASLVGWNEKRKEPAELDSTNMNFRPFITTWDGSELYIAESVLRNLGYGASKSYGITMSTNPVVQEEFVSDQGDLRPPTGWILDSRFEKMYFGFYSFEAEDVVIVGNVYRNNVIYGIDPHDRSSGLIIARNTVDHTKKKHGIILSRQVNDSYVFDNTTSENAGSGIMLDRGCVNTVVSGNRAYYNKGDGITIYESPDNILFKNTIENNRSGIRLRNSWGIVSYGDTISSNRESDIVIYEDDLLTTSRDFVIDPVIPRTEVKLLEADLGASRSSIKTKGFHRIEIRGGTWRHIKEEALRGDIAPYAKTLAKHFLGGEDVVVQSRSRAREKTIPAELSDYASKLRQ